MTRVAVLLCRKLPCKDGDFLSTSQGAHSEVLSRLVSFRARPLIGEWGGISSVMRPTRGVCSKWPEVQLNNRGGKVKHYFGI